MLSRSTLLHLRIPFSFYLMPVFFFAASRPHYFTGPEWSALGTWTDFFNDTDDNLGIWRFLIAFISIHIFLYPASNGYNSYYDKDEESIGGLENPPPVSKELLYTSLLFDGFVICLGLIISWQFAVMLFIYGLVSKAYSHPAIRLKKYGVIAWLTAGIFQGGFTFLMVIIGLREDNFSVFTRPNYLLPATVATLMILGFYPLTQIYQHEEDAKHGDNTISRQVGIKGTFILSLILFLIADAGFYQIYRYEYLYLHGSDYHLLWFWILQAFLLPVFGYFLWWFYKTSRDESAANFRNTMRMNKIASWCLVLFFLIYAFCPYWY